MADVLDPLLLKEIHYSKIDNAIPLVEGNGFHVYVTIAHYAALEHTVQVQRRQTDTPKKPFFSGILQFDNNLV